MCTLVCSGLSAAEEEANQAACAAKLQAMAPDDPAFKRLDKVFRQSLRFSGTVHRIVPHWHATYQDLRAAKNKLSVQDIPYMVKGLALIDKLDARQRVAVGVLGLFGVQALPCIEAALQDPGIKGRFMLEQIKIQIAVDRPSATPAR